MRSYQCCFFQVPGPDKSVPVVVAISGFGSPFLRGLLKALQTTTAISDAKSHAHLVAIVRFLTCQFMVTAFRGHCKIRQKSSFHGGWLAIVVVLVVVVSAIFCLSMMARWRSRHFTVVATLGPWEAELGHFRVVVCWCFSFMCCLEVPPFLP